MGRSVVDTAVVVVTRNGGSILILAKCHQIHELTAVFELVRECILVVVLASLVLAETVFEMAACGRCSRSCTPVGIGLSKTVVSKSVSVIIVVVVASVIVTFSSCRSGSCSTRGGAFLHRKRIAAQMTWYQLRLLGRFWGVNQDTRTLDGAKRGWCGDDGARLRR